MATKKDEEEDVHNPFGDAPLPNKGRGPKPGVFDNGFGDGDTEDPFIDTDQDRDGDWDDNQDDSSSRNT